MTAERMEIKATDSITDRETRNLAFRVQVEIVEKKQTKKNDPEREECPNFRAPPR
jgi:hypothetical protein